jgi:putative SOS response-associated peptidase YedK
MCAVGYISGDQWETPRVERVSKLDGQEYLSLHQMHKRLPKRRSKHSKSKVEEFSGTFECDVDHHARQTFSKQDFLMCGRAYETYSDEELYFRYLGANSGIELSLSLTPVYNLCPTQTSPVLRVIAGNPRFDIMRWQLVPRTEPAFTTKLSTINARSETVFGSPLYRDPFRIQLRDEPIMSVAGLWDTWQAGTPEAKHSFSILTTSANELMGEIHDRMPVILSRSDEQSWLDPENNDRETLKSMLRPCASSQLDVREVSTLVNSPKNNSPALLDPPGPEAKLHKTPRLFD